MIDRSKLLAKIDACDDTKLLRSWIKNARDQNADDIAQAAWRRLIAIVPSEQPGTVEHDFCQTINAFELSLSDERGKTIRLARTRQKVARVGVIETLKDWALSPKSTEGFEMLLERGMPEYTGEAIVLRHRDAFSDEVRAAARRRLEDAGLDPDGLGA